MKKLLLISAAAVFAMSACGGGDDPVVEACERLDECNALNAGVGVETCVESVEVQLDNSTPSARADWEGIMRSCLSFNSCDVFLNCVNTNGL